MRKQYPIYNQNNNSIYNKVINNVNMSADYCAFKGKSIIIDNAIKIEKAFDLCDLTNIDLQSVLDTVKINSDCFISLDWKLVLIEDIQIIDTINFSNETNINDLLPTNLNLTNLVKQMLSNNGYIFTGNNNIITVQKKKGVEDLDIVILAELNLEDNCDDCPDGYDLTSGEQICEKLTYDDITIGSTVGLVPGGKLNVYGVSGLRTLSLNDENIVFPIKRDGGCSDDLVLVDQNDVPLPIIVSTVTNNLWGTGLSLTGRLNNIGIKPNVNDSELLTTNDCLLQKWFGFTKCIEIDSSGLYTIAMAANNYFRFKLNDVELVSVVSRSTRTFRFWWGFEIELSAGKNIIEMVYSEDGDVGSSAFACEIYSTDSTVLSGLTNETELDPYIVFSTRDVNTIDVTPNPLSGYTCSSGFSVDLCGDEPTCVKIEKADRNENSEISNICGYEFDTLTKNTDGVFVIDNETENIEFQLSFTGNTINITDETEFKYSIFKYNKNNKSFNKPSIYDSIYQSYSSISGGTVDISVPINNLNLDGEYIIKGYYRYPSCTLYSNKLGLTIDESLIKNGSEYGMYSANEDWYFIGIKASEQPLILNITEPQILTTSNFNVSSYTPDFNGQTDFILGYIPKSGTIVSLNGLTLSSDEYLIDNTTLILSGDTFTTDIITVISVINDDDFITSNLHIENITINTSIQSGATDTQLSNVFYNTTTNKYELFTEFTPSANSDIVITLNGVTLANNIDYYRSVSNNNRVILEGNLFLNDIITITYIKSLINIGVDNGNVVLFSWSVENINPSEIGSFYVEIADLNDVNFTNVLQEVEIPYVPNVSLYNKEVLINGVFGEVYLYRIKNRKKYYTLNNQLVIDDSFSEVGKIKIESNNQNTY